MRQGIFLVSLWIAPFSVGQFNVPVIPKPEHPHAQLESLPDNRWPDEATLKAEYAKSLAEVGDIVRMAREVQAALEKADHQSLPADAMKMLGEIEKRAKSAKRRLKR